MTEEPVAIPKPVYRRARLEDFFDENEDKPITHKYNENHSHNDSISKNQQEFGHKKRIKP
jgi:hypothetical protein